MRHSRTTQKSFNLPPTNFLFLTWKRPSHTHSYTNQLLKFRSKKENIKTNNETGKKKIMHGKIPQKDFNPYVNAEVIEISTL